MASPSPVVTGNSESYPAVLVWRATARPALSPPQRSWPVRFSERNSQRELNTDLQTA